MRNKITTLTLTQSEFDYIKKLSEKDKRSIPKLFAYLSEEYGKKNYPSIK